MTSSKNKEKGISAMFSIIIVIAVIIIAAALYVNFKNKEKGTDVMKDDLYVRAPTIEIQIGEMNGSGIHGTGYIVKAGTGVEVSVVFESPDGKSHPAHIHTGSCASLGSIAYPLSDVENGLSETVIPASFDQISSEKPLAINMHESADNMGNYIACGDLPN